MRQILLQILRRFLRAERGASAVMFALAAPVLALSVAMAIDMRNQSIVRTRLKAAADAAVLSGLAPENFGKSDSTAGAAAVASFKARTTALSSFLDGTPTATATVGLRNGSAGSRQIQIDYSARVNNLMGLITGTGALTVTDKSVGYASLPPNIDFYLLLDNSPSMAIAATQAGINQMVSLTWSGGQCAFACHQKAVDGNTLTDPCTDDQSPPHYTGPIWGVWTCPATDANGRPLRQIDRYELARLNNIRLRIDDVSAGVSALMTTASNYQKTVVNAQPPVYRFAAYAMNPSWATQWMNCVSCAATPNTQVMPLTSDFVAGWTANSSKFAVQEVWDSGHECSDASCTAIGRSTNGGDTNFEAALSSVNTALPSPGNGTNASGDRPQEVLFFVTDGVEDFNYGGWMRVVQLLGGGYSYSSWCSAIKGRGVKIAILYTEYLPLPNNGFYNATVGQWQNQIAPTLQACASPGLFFKAALGTDLNAAFATLFANIVHSAALTQ